MNPWRGSTPAGPPASTLAERPLLLDGILAVVLAALGQWELWQTPHADTARHVGHSAVGVLLALMVTLPVALRRRASRAALGVILAGGYLQALLSYQDQNAALFGTVFGVFAVAALHSRWSSVPAAVLAAGVPLSRELLIVHDNAPQFAFAMVFVGVVMSTAWFVGDLQQRRLRRISDAESDAQEVERQSGARALQAASEERTRIARELHDVVTHSLTVMVVQAGAARTVLDHEDGPVREALLGMESTGRQTLAEMRRILGLLRKDERGRDTLAPQPTLEHISLLIEQFGRAGLGVVLAIQGQPRALPPSLEVSAYRIVQEALTNTLKHANATSARVQLDYEADALEIEVRDDGSGVGAAHGDPGYGLVGMRERVAVFGGVLEAHPLEAAGFRVRARLPLELAMG